MATFEQVCAIAHVASMYKLRVPILPVCREHQSPGMMLAQFYYDRPSLALWHGPRGSGKSHLTGFGLYRSCQRHEKFEAKILGGSLAQSLQIYEALQAFRDALPEADTIEELLKTQAKFKNRSVVEVLTASPKSARGPHIPCLCLDEVDETDDDVRESAMGMAMRKNGLSSSIFMTSTWHKIAGPMASLVARGNEGEFPVGTFCMFDVLERCPEERSGPGLEKCPECPIVRWCHADRDQDPQGRPKAKRSCGHYAIDAFIQKARAVSLRVFESDYLCRRPRPNGQWFKDFDEAVHVGEEAEFRPHEPFHVAVDAGNCTAAVWFQVRRSQDGISADVNVFGDYFAENIEGGAEANGQAIGRRTMELTGLATDAGTVSMDPAGSQKTPIGVTVRGEFQRAGCVGRYREIKPWPAIGPGRPKTDTLALLEALLRSADGTVSIHFHPRCTRLIEGLVGYVRARTSDGQWLDQPEDPQHPHEDLIDAMVGGLTLELPRGRTPRPRFKNVPTSHFM